MNKINAAVVGVGVVGQATADAFNIKKRFDLKRERSTVNLEEVSRCQLIFLCLPTPTLPLRNQQDVAAIDNIIQQIKGYGNRNFFVVRSTTLPGTVRHLKAKHGVQVIHNPEFLSEDTAFEDTVNPDVVVIGADPDCGQASVTLENLYGISQISARRGMVKTDSVTSEMAKYACNLFFATKVSFANMIHDLCDINGAKYDDIRNVMYSNKFIGENHLDINHKGYRGYGGSCLPKDVKAFIGYMNPRLMELVDSMNQEKKWI